MIEKHPWSIVDHVSAIQGIVKLDKEATAVLIYDFDRATQLSNLGQTLLHGPKANALPKNSDYQGLLEGSQECFHELVTKGN